MRVMINFSILTLGTDGNKVNDIINRNSQLLKFQKTIVDYNDQYALSTYDKKTILEIAEDVGTLATMSMNAVKHEHFTFFYEDSTCFKVQGSKIYQLNNLDVVLNKDIIIRGFNLTFKEYLERNIINVEDFRNSNLNEDFIILNLFILEKGKPFVIIEPGELKSKSPHPCWNFVANLRRNDCYRKSSDDDDDDDNYDPHPEDWWI